MKKCSIDGCKKPISSRGWCSMHYARWRRHGHMNPLREVTRYYGASCLISNCHSKVAGRGWCEKHYTRWKRHKNPLITQTNHHGFSKTREYHHWADIKDRCHNPNNKAYKNYGGRGIFMYEPWHNSYMEFKDYLLNTIGPRPDRTLTLDRIDNNRGYEPGNLRWATWHEQNTNTRRQQA